jgi:Cu2+-exporting ATPase
MGERLREDALSALSALRERGWSLTLLSGDRADRAQALAKAAGLHNGVGDATPQDKLAAVHAARAAGQRVMMVGDGVNDAPVLAAADVSVAMGHGALAARRHADAVIVSDRLAGLADLVDVAERTRRITGQNLVWAAAYNAACVPLAIAGWVPPWLAGLGMALSSLAVVLNASRVAR